MMKRQWILIRGLGREQAHWEDFKQQLQIRDPESEVLGLDLPGAGKFYRLSSPMTIHGIAEFVHSQLPERKSGQKRILVAISLGGMVASEMVYLHPEDYDGMVLINSSFKNFSGIFQRLQTEALIHFYKAATAHSPVAREREILNMVSQLPSERKDEVAKKWAQIALERPVSAMNFFKQLAAAAIYEAPEQKPKVPVLVLTSEADNMVSFRCSKTIARHWEVPIEIHESAGHEMALDAPDWVIEKILKHFKT
ncbi:MAG: alpha/beta hydrolase [Bdellovibrionales bacterium]|nr:alpha/beta hydrolase [Bdellovibrionales bacterium]